MELAPQENIGMQCDLEVHWHISHFCNFRCAYCFCGSQSGDIFRGVEDIPKIVDAFDRLGRTCLINISGGEPFLYRDFIALCRRLTARHQLCVNTNLSHNDVYRFIEEIDPGKVRYLNCSLHISERERMRTVEDFIEKFNALTANGFQAFATYVMYPPLLTRFGADYAFFKSRGIIVRPKIFRGTFNRFNLPDAWLRNRPGRCLRRLYPNAYTPGERKKILCAIERSRREGGDVQDLEDAASGGRMLNVGQDRLFMDGLPSFTGRPCRTGMDFVRVTPEGEAHRCHGGICRLGNLFEEGITLFERPTPCTFETCVCPYLGYAYAAEE